MRTPVSTSFVAIFAAIVTACGGAEDPSGPASNAPASIVPISDTALAAAVGTTVPDAPAVRVLDAQGRPVAGARVTFRVTSGGGTIVGQETNTDIEGIARVESWFLGIVPGSNEMNASTGALAPVRFMATAVVGRPANMTKLAGDGQIGPPGTALKIPPSVRVTDVYGNSVSGFPVSFSAQGGGAAMPSTVITDANGIAAIAWTLGSSGTQELFVAAFDLEAMFTAVLIQPFTPCSPENILLLDTRVSAELGSESCRSTDGRYYETAQIVITKADAYEFSATSGVFNTSLELRGQYPIAINDDRSGTNAGFKAFLAPGTYSLIITSSKPQETGQFFVELKSTSHSVNNCEPAFVVRSVVTRQTTNYTDCVFNTAFEQSDRFFVFLRAGEQIALQVDDLSYSNHGLFLSTESGRLLATGQHIGFYRDTLTFAATETGYYRIDVSNLGEDGAEYNLSLN